MIEGHVVNHAGMQGRRGMPPYAPLQEKSLIIHELTCEKNDFFSLPLDLSHKVKKIWVHNIV